MFGTIRTLRGDGHLAKLTNKSALSKEGNKLLYKVTLIELWKPSVHSVGE